MAPKGKPRGKRAAEAEGGGSPKKAKVVDPVADMCGQIEKALGQIPGLSDSCQGMLAAMVPGSLGTAKGERHAHQETVVGMLGGVLGGVLGGLEEKAAEEKSQLDGVVKEKAELEGRRDAAEAAAAQKAEALAERQVARDEKAEKTKDAEAVFKVAQKAHSEANKELVSAGELKARCLAALDGSLKTVKEGTWAAAKEATKLTHELVDLGKECALDQSLLKGIVSAGAKSPAERGTFDVMVVEQFEGTLQKQVEPQTQKIAEHEKVVAERAGEAKTAEDALAAAKAEQAACQEAVDAADKELKELKGTSQAAKKGLREVEKKLKRAQAAVDAAEAQVGKFKSTTLATFETLKSYDPATAPEPEPAGDPEAAAEPEAAA